MDRARRRHGRRHRQRDGDAVLHRLPAPRAWPQPASRRVGSCDDRDRKLRGKPDRRFSIRPNRLAADIDARAGDRRGGRLLVRVRPLGGGGVRRSCGDRSGCVDLVAGRGLAARIGCRRGSTFQRVRFEARDDEPRLRDWSHRCSRHRQLRLTRQLRAPLPHRRGNVSRVRSAARSVDGRWKRRRAG